MTVRALVFNVTAQVTVVPSWAKLTSEGGSLSLYQWTTLPSTQLLPVMPPIFRPSGSAVALAGICSYSGGALHPTTLDYFMFGGGHDDYNGNEIYRLNLAAETPQWTQVQAKTGPSGGSLYPAGTPTRGAAYYWDGRPSSRHTWFSLHVIPELGASGQLLSTGAGAVNGDGNGSFNTLDAWDIATGAWTWINPDPIGSPNGPNPQFLPYSTSGVPAESVKDTRGHLWVVFVSQGTRYLVAKFNAVTKAWSNPVTINRNRSPVLYDSLRDRVVMLPYDTGATGRHFSAVDGGSLTSFTFGANAPTNYDGTAWYEPNADKYVYMPRGVSDLWYIDPVTFSSTVVTTTSKPTISGDAGYLSHYTRLHYIPQYKGMIYLNSVSTNVYFVRTS